MVTSLPDLDDARIKALSTSQQAHYKAYRDRGMVRQAATMLYRLGVIPDPIQARRQAARTAANEDAAAKAARHIKDAQKSLRRAMAELEKVRHTRGTPEHRRHRHLMGSVAEANDAMRRAARGPRFDLNDPDLAVGRLGVEG